MLAQLLTGDSGTYTALGGLATVILVQLSKILSDRRKDSLNLLMETHKSKYLERIADSNEKALVAQTEVKETLLAHGTVDKMRHDIVVEALNKLTNAVTTKQN